jgi:hypothetical protein
MLLADGRGDSNRPATNAQLHHPGRVMPWIARSTRLGMS